MVLRNIVRIDKERCNGCGQCVNACAEGAIQLINGKAEVVSETYCDGLGACIGHCPQDAITIEQRQAPEFDEQAVKKHLDQIKSAHKNNSSESKKLEINFSCPGMSATEFSPSPVTDTAPQNSDTPSQLAHWPVQLKLVSPAAPYFKNADLLLTADCVPFAMPDFHNKLLTGHAVAVGCPKLDDTDYYIEKLTEIIKTSNLNSLTIVHMEVPCCSALTTIAKQAIKNSDVNISFKDITVSIRGQIIRTENI